MLRSYSQRKDIMGSIRVARREKRRVVKCGASPLSADITVTRLDSRAGARPQNAMVTAAKMSSKGSMPTRRQECRRGGRTGGHARSTMGSEGVFKGGSPVAAPRNMSESGRTKPILDGAG